MYHNPYHWGQNPYHANQNPHHLQQQPMHMQTHQLKQQTLSTVEPFVQYGLQEAQKTSYPHAMREVAAIAYLIGKGYDPQMAYQMVESWEMNEVFY